MDCVCTLLSFYYPLIFLFFFQCPLLNISYCPGSEVDLSQGKKLVRKIFFPYYVLSPCNNYDCFYSIQINTIFWCLLIFVGSCGLQFSWMEEERCNSNSCEYFHSYNSVLCFVYVNAHLYVYETLSKCEPGPVECKVSN